MRLTDPPVAAVVMRVFSTFLAYSVLSQLALHPISFCCIAFVVAGAWHIVSGGVGLRRVRGVSFKSLSMIGLYGLWCAVDMLVFITALVKLHPFRLAIGEYIEYLAPLVTRGSLTDDFGHRYRRKTAITLMAVSFCLLGFANNLAHYTPPALPVEASGQDSDSPQEGAGEDLISSIDTVGGMALLLFYIVSDALRKRYRARAIADCEDEVNVDSLSAVFGALVLTAVTVVYLVTTVSVLGSGAPSIGLIGCFWIIVSAACIFAVPTILASRATFRGRVVGSAAGMPPHVRVLLTVGAAFILHVTFHQHYRMGAAIGEAPHPVWHVDNLIVLIAGAMIAFAVHVGGLHALRHTSLTSSSLDPVTLFDPMEGGTVQMGFISTILSNSKQRRLATFFSLTMFYMLVELIYGLHSNSLGLVSDSFHMLLDSASIAIGLFAAYMAVWKPDASHAYGFGRYEVLSGFTNGVLLVFIAGYVLVEALARLFDPPKIGSDYLVFVSVCGLVVNIIGIVFFHEAHAHGHSGGGDCGHSHDLNMQGVYLHILGDFLGSVSVIVSSVIVRFTGFMAADPICSAFVSLLILVSSVGLLRETGAALLQRVPSSSEGSWDGAKRQLAKIDGVAKVIESNLWVQATSPSVLNVVTVHLLASADAGEAQVRQQAIAVLRSHGFHHCIAVEVQKKDG